MWVIYWVYSVIMSLWVNAFMVVMFCFIDRDIDKIFIFYYVNICYVFVQNVVYFRVWYFKNGVFIFFIYDLSVYFSVFS